MDERSVPGATGADALEAESRPGVPGSVQTAFLLWIVAVAAGLFETALVVAEALSGGSISGGSISTSGLVVEGRAWAEVHFDDVDGRWITTASTVLITYVATARWNYESTSSRTLCASVYVRVGGAWRVAFHQQTPI